MCSVPWDLKFLSGFSAYPDFVPAAFPVEVTIIGPEYFLYLAYFHVLPPYALIIARINTCVNNCLFSK